MSENNSRKVFDSLVSRTKIYLVIILILFILISVFRPILIIPSIILYISILCYTYFANNKRKSEISEQLQDLTLTVDVCLAMSEVAPEVLSNIMGVAYVNPIGYPELPSGSSSPNVSKNVILGGFFGFVLSIGLVFALKFLNNTVDDEETLRNKFGIPVLGEIPVYTANESEGANNV